MYIFQEQYRCQNNKYNFNIEYSTETISLLNGEVLHGNRERLVPPRMQNGSDKLQRIHVQNCFVVSLQFCRHILRLRLGSSEHVLIVRVARQYSYVQYSNPHISKQSFICYMYYANKQMSSYFRVQPKKTRPFQGSTFDGLINPFQTFIIVR